METTLAARGFVRHLPNTMSWIRILGTLALPFLIRGVWEWTWNLPIVGTWERAPVVWLAVFVFLALTDKADGTLARRLRVESKLGATLDTVGDALLLVMGASTVFAVFARPNLTAFEFVFYVFIMLTIVLFKVIAFAVAKKYHGEGNDVHTIPHKVFAVGAFVAISLWAATRDIQPWSILLLWAIMIYAFVDEIVYVVRTAVYDVDFKGHGLQKYALRRDLATA